jgi:cytoskeleton protein RodZ
MAKVESNEKGPGDLLKAARTKAGLTKDDVATQLKLLPNTISQLETNQYTDDIPDAFLRGYLRSYARIVNLDENLIVSLYTELTGKVDVQNYYKPSTDVEPVKTQIGNHLLWVKMISLLVFIVILILGWLALTKTDVIPKSPVSYLPKPEINKKISSNTSKNTTSKFKQPVQFQQKELVGPDEAEVNDLSADDSNQENPELVDSSLVDSSLVDNATLSAAVVNTPVISNAELEFNFIDDCWVQVIDSNGEVLAVGLKSAGRRFNVSGYPPITVVLGKPRAVTIQYNDLAVDLSIYPASSSARFTLGERALGETALDIQ